MDNVVRDSNGTPLADGDSVLVIKDLKVKGSSIPLKRGTLIKNIRLRDGDEEVEGNSDKIKGLMLKGIYGRELYATCYATSHILATPERFRAAVPPAIPPRFPAEQRVAAILAGGHVVIPQARHGLLAVTDAVVLLTAAKA